MYGNKFEPRVGDRVRRNWYDANMAEGEEGVVADYNPCGDKIKIIGKPDNAGFLASFFDLIARPVRYSDGNDAAVGDLVECVKRSQCADMVIASGEPGERFVVEEIFPRKDDVVPGIGIRPIKGSTLSTGVNVDRFKLIARVCPYKVGDWVHSAERGVEFKITEIRSDFDGWRLDGTNGCISWRVDFIKPGRLPPAKPIAQPAGWLGTTRRRRRTRRL